MTASSGRGPVRNPRVEAPAGQGVQIADHNRQGNKFIGPYLKQQSAQARVPLAWPVQVGDLPQRPVAGGGRRGRQYGGRGYVPCELGVSRRWQISRTNDFRRSRHR
jgi:hypothetical protein